MSESILTASYRATNLTDSERQSIINDTAAKVEASTAKTKSISISFSYKYTGNGGSLGTRQYKYYNHGMKSIQTVTFIPSVDCYYGTDGANTNQTMSAGQELPIGPSLIRLGSSLVDVQYSSSQIIFTWQYTSTGRYRGSIIGVARLYGTY